MRRPLVAPARRWSWQSGDVAIWTMLLAFFLIALCIVYSNISLTPPASSPLSTGSKS